MKIMDMNELFQSYVHRLRHVMFINFLIIELVVSSVYTILLLSINVSYQFTVIRNIRNTVGNHDKINISVDARLRSCQSN